MTASTPASSTAPCTRCEGSGYVETGVDEAPTELCRKCDGTGSQPVAAAPAAQAAQAATIKTWQERTGKPVCHVLMREHIDAMKDEIADLRAALQQRQAPADQIAAVILRLIGEGAMDWKAGPTGDPEEDAFHSDAEELRVLVDLVNKALAQQAEAAPKCPACGGNDADAPCAYPSAGKAGCLRDARLAEAAPVATCQHNFLHESGSLFRRCTKCGDIEAPAAPVASAEPMEDRWHSLTCDGTCSPPCKDAPIAQAAPAPADEWKPFVDKAVAVLQRHIVPDGLSDHAALLELYDIFDGPEFRAMGTIPQMDCDMRQAREASTRMQAACYPATPAPEAAEPVADNEHAVIALLPQIHSNLINAYRAGAMRSSGNGIDADAYKFAEKIIRAWDLPDAAPVASQPAPLDADEMTRLRRLIHALGMDGEVTSDETVRGLLFTALGQAAGKIERASQQQEQESARLAAAPAGQHDAIMGAVARGWCDPANEKKEIDHDLVMAITREVEALLTSRAQRTNKEVSDIASPAGHPATGENNG